MIDDQMAWCDVGVGNEVKGEGPAYTDYRHAYMNCTTAFMIILVQGYIQDNME